jgi:hypothetical protein
MPRAAFPAPPRAPRVDGPVGGAQDFNSGSQGWIALPNGYDPGADRFTLHMWIYNEGRSSAYLFIKSARNYADQRFELDLDQGTGDIGFGSKGVRVQAGFGAPAAAWQLLGVVCDRDSVRFYANGVLKSARAFSLGGSSAADVLIGVRNPQGETGFPGRLDEIWSWSGARDAWYMRLLYENQKPGSTLATFNRL